MIEELLTNMEGSNLLLFIVLILLFIVGYKILQAVISLGMVAVLSGVFFVSLSILGLGPEVTVDRFILFMVLGTGLFIVYSSLATAMKTTGSVVGLLTKIGNLLIRPLKAAVAKERKKRRKKKLQSKHHHIGGKDDDSDSKEKEIVLGELEDE